VAERADANRKNPVVSPRNRDRAVRVAPSNVGGTIDRRKAAPCGIDAESKSIHHHRNPNLQLIYAKGVRDDINAKTLNRIRRTLDGEDD